MDRNVEPLRELLASGTSLSARRAWIEIGKTPEELAAEIVALRKESVDRNPAGQRVQRNFAESLSARRAWIEIVILII